MPRTMTLSIAAVAAQDEARNHDVVPRADKGPRADIAQFRGRCRIEIVDFDQAHTRAVILASNDRRILSRIRASPDR